jgi:seryl-tRNA synthetase
MPVTVAAQTVQGSAFPDAYAKHQNNATQVVHTLNNTH